MAEIGKDYNDERDKNLAVLCHASSPIAFLLFQGFTNGGLILIPIANWLAPLGIWLILRERYDSVALHGKKVLNFQITFSAIVIIYQMLNIFLVTGLGYYLSLKDNIEELSNLQLEKAVDVDSLIRGIDSIANSSPLFLCLFAIIILGLLGHFFLWLASFILSGIAAYRAKKGHVFNYPFSLEIFK